VSAVTPTISGVSPASANPGTALAITGTNFASGATVTIGGTNAPVTAVTSTSITATVPALAVGSSPVIVTVGGTASNAFNVSITAATPVITSFTPTSTTAGQSITITGTGFAPGATVTIGGQAATVVGTPTSTTIVATVPALAPGNYSVIATVSGVGSTAGSALSVTTGTPVPTVSACSGTVGGTFNVTGTNFVAGSTSVTLGGTSAVTTAVTATSITANVPSGAVAGTSAVVVTVSGQSSSSFSCTLTPAVVGGTITTDSQGNTIPIPSKNPNTMGPIHPGLNGANAGGSVLQFQNAWDVAASGRCANATPAISRIWYHNLNYPSYQGTNQVEFFGIAANEALVYSFVAPADGTHASFQFNESPYATSVAQLASISDVPCDFDPNKIGVASSSPYFSCVRSFNGSGNTLSFYSSAGAPSGFAECKLTPGTRYYINYRSWNPGSSGVPATDACFTSTQSTTALCGGLLSFR
jgi:hypothetical protein